MDRLYLKFPSKEDKENILEFKDEFLASGQKVAGFAGLDKMNFDEWLSKIERERFKETCEEGRVPATQFLAIRKEDEKLVGMVQVRHVLNDYLLKFGGHIGDCVRPSEQGKGYATRLVMGILKNYKKYFGIKPKVLYGLVKKTNTESQKFFQKLGKN